MIMRTLNCNSVIFYLKQNQNNFSISKLLDWGIEIMNGFNLSPNYIGISGNNYSEKIVKIKTGLAKLTKNNYQDVQSFELYYSETNSPSYDWEICFILSISDHIEIYLGGNNELINSNTIKQKLNTFLSQFTYESIYGYYFSRPFNLGPEFYPFGVGYGDISDDELSQCTIWRKDLAGNQQFFNGKIRELYPLNILHENHLNFRLNNGKLFREFILQNDLKLDKIEKDTYLLYVYDTEIFNNKLNNLGLKTY
jgi:hypothetical protein